MTEFRGTYRATAGRRHALSTRSADAGPIIDGTAEVTNRRALPKSAVAIDAARRDLTTGMMNDAGPSPAREVFGQRDPRDLGTARSSARRNAPHDLFSQAFARCHSALPASPVSHDAAGQTILTRARAFRIRNAALVVGGFLIGLLAVPILLLSTPESPVAAPYADANRTGLVLRDIETNIAPRGDGAVLSISGTVVNATATSALVPPLHIALTDGGGKVRTKPLSAGVERLGPGRSVRFVSALAVPSGTEGEVSIRFGEHRKRQR